MSIAQRMGSRSPIPRHKASLLRKSAVEETWEMFVMRRTNDIAERLLDASRSELGNPMVLPAGGWSPIRSEDQYRGQALKASGN